LKGAMMLTPKPFRLLTPLLAGAIALAACGGTPSAPASTPAPTAAPPAPTAVPQPTSAPAPTAAVSGDQAAPTSAPPPPTAAPAPNPTSDPVTGAPGLARGALQQRPIAVMIDNHPDAYPQTGLDRAAVIFEALAEFGVTRFMAVYVPG